MPLPKIAVPEYDCRLPVSGTKVSYRPFLVKEEKLLYLAMESQDDKEMIKAVKNILKSCTDVKDVDKLATFEIEYLFLRIRAKAVGETSEFKITCEDDGETMVPVELNLEEVEVVVPKEHRKILKLSDELKVEMKYPSLNAFVDRNMKDAPTMDDVFELAADCIDKVYQGDETYDSFTKKEALEFIGDMNNEQFQKVQQFFETMPKLQHTLKVVNPKTNVENEVVLEGLAAFFA
ncbi:baseplate protein [Synechococcus phage S-SZBM1]|uniref:Baseplate protein n=1 Tax=Synechococcus phage S-SZBM1 TaxID=2926475 RepID=A0AC61TSG8_9CAUD|nr:baseplate hub [Synechococcus phage S-SZBM1]UNH61186.1 baseplate protein [Synechococcus phage S-SZBM1]